MPKCKCGEEAKLLIVKKQGSNFGKGFYACPKPREEQCDYFDWAKSQPNIPKPTGPDWDEIRNRKEDTMEWMNAKNNSAQIVAALIQKGEIGFIDWYETFKSITSSIYSYKENGK